MESQRGPMDWKLGFSRQIGTPTSATPSPRPSDPPPMAVEGANPQRLAWARAIVSRQFRGAGHLACAKSNPMVLSG